MSNVNKQLRALMNDGLTLAQACRSLDLDVEAGALALATMAPTQKETSLGDLVERFKPEAVNILMEIAQNGERDADRVKACQILLEGKGVMPEINAAAVTQFKARFLQMRQNLGLVIDVIPDEQGMMAMAK